jgi:predicted nucleotidyltransferase
MTPRRVASAIFEAVDISAPQTALTAKNEGRILTVLARTTRPLSGREVARLAETSQHGAWRVLRRFTEHGIVSVQEAGSGAALLHTLNRDHVAADAVLILANLRGRFIDRLKEALQAWKVQPLHASVFGSMARADGDTESDIDLFLVRPDRVGEDDDQWRSQLNTLAEAIWRWTGNHAGIAEVSPRDVQRLRRERPAIVDELESDAIVLVGASPKELFHVKGKRV